MRDFDDRLLAAIKKRQEQLEKQLERATGEWIEEDFIYRFYHGSFKVYALQSVTNEIVALFREIAEELSEGSPRKLNRQFSEILIEGTGKKWDISHNQRWDEETRPIVEAFFHAKYFLQMMVKYGKELEEAPQCLPSGWASVLYLYRAR